MPRLRILAALVAAAPLALAGPQAATAVADVQPCRDAPTGPVRTGAVLNNPAEGDPTAVVRQVCSLVKQAPPGSLVRIAHFVVSGSAGLDFAQQVVAAHDRGVRVQVVLDGWQDTTPAAQLLREGLGEDAGAESWLHVCSNVSPEGNTSSCLGTKGMHNKFYLFSQTGDADNVVVQSSANFTDVNSRSYWNNALTLVGNERLYAAYGRYFEELAAEQRTDRTRGPIHTGMRGGPVTAYFFPVVDGDPVLDELEGVRCHRGGTVRVGMSEWDDTRIALAERLGELAEAGCRVRVVHGPLEPGVTATFAAHPSIETRALDSSALPGRIHSKFLVVDAGDGARSRWVLTGSHNYNATSLRRNDEALVKVADRSVVRTYATGFDRMFAHAQ
ncbi:phospholipase D-like domain-containing protein [Terrabacter sp. NPDC000476]|uniref:phospholipase D-like domain-containing protein n=1 Tax=Terrabacter sp. NPDC000476 TaxID=3154258 RepID=UPI00331B8EF4